MNNDLIYFEYETLSETRKEEISESLSKERKKIFERINEDSKELSENLDFEEKIELNFTKEIKVSWKFTKAKKEVEQKLEKESDVEIAKKFVEGILDEE